MSSQFFRIKEHVLPCQYIREYPGATLCDQDEMLQLHVKQYVPWNGASIGANAITIIAAHANGFPKVNYPGADSIVKHCSDGSRNSMSHYGTSCISGLQAANSLYEASGSPMLQIKA